MKRPLRHNIDKIIKDRLEGLQPPYEPGHWDMLEERLNNGALEEEVSAGRPIPDFKEMDTVLFNKMHNFHPPFQSPHWPRMEQLLQRAFDWPKYVLHYKSLEAALVFLLFLGLWQYFPQHHTETKIQAFRIPTLPTGQQPSPSVGNTRTEINNLSPADLTANETGDQLENAALADTAPASAEKGSSRKSATDKPALSSLPLVPHQDIASDADIQLPSDALLFSTDAPTASGKASVVEPVEQRPFSRLTYDGNSLENVRHAKMKHSPVLRLAMFGNGEFNHIVVPASADQRLSESFERAAFGYGSGLSLGMGFGRIELEAGLVYAARRYPVGLVYLEGSVAGGFEGDELRTTELNIISLPLHLRYNIVRGRKWRGYILGGGAVQVAFQTNYYTADGPPQYNFQPAMPIYSDGGNDGAEKAIDRIRQNGVGWFEGGSFEDNAYLTANLGFGVERFISERWSLFAQPVYQYSFHYFKNINGLGPNKDRINSMSLFLGTRVRLK